MAPTDTYGAAVYADTPLAYWRLGESSGQFADVMGSHPTTSIQGSPTYGATGLISGTADTAVTFTRVTNWGVVPDSAAFHFGDGDWSVEAWVKFASLDTGEQWFFGGWSGSDGHGWAIGIDSTGAIDLYYGDGLGGGALAHSTEAPVSVGSAYHVVVTKASGVYAFYANGVALTTGGGTIPTVTDAGHSWGIGAAGDSNSNSIGGTVDEVALYDAALTLAQVQAHYTAGTAATAALADQHDALAASGALTITGTAALADQPDSSAMAGAEILAATAALADQHDGAAASGAVAITGTAALADQPDTTAASGAVATAALTDQPDSMAASGALTVTATGAAADEPDALAASGALTVDGTAALADQADAAAASGALTRQAAHLATTLEYVLEIFDYNSSTFGRGAKLGELWDVRNLGWSRYDRLPGKAFGTLAQTSRYLSMLTPLLTHVRITRISSVAVKTVLEGEYITSDSTGDDVVLTILDYLSLLQLSRTGYQTTYPSKKIGSEIVSPEWLLAKGATGSLLSFVATGTIQDPLGTDGTTAIAVNAEFGTIDQSRLQLFHDLSEVGRANTTNQVSFEITLGATPTFNFWKNKGSNVELALVLGGAVNDYHYLPNWQTYRNNLASVATGETGGTGEITATDATGITAKGLRQAAIAMPTILGVVAGTTEADQQAAALKRALVVAEQLQPTLQLVLAENRVTPFDGWDLCDKPLLEIGNGLESISGRWRLVGASAVVNEQGEHLALYVSPVVT